MSTRISHRLVGYDKTTGIVAVEHTVENRHLSFAKRVAGVGPDDPDAVMCYRLDRMQAADVAGTIGARIDPVALNYYFEGFAEQSP